jgi:Spy/CpxP family protein refolding chaperone
MRAKSLIAASAVALTLSLGAFALAQPAPDDGPGPPPAEMRQHHERMLADVKTILRLRPDQEAAFQALAQNLGPQTFTLKIEAPKEGLTTPQLMAEHAKAEAAMRAGMDKRMAAVTSFYAVLSADQKQVFDALVRLHHMHGGGMDMIGGPRMMGVVGPGGPEIRRIIRHGGPGGDHVMGGPPGQ